MFPVAPRWRESSVAGASLYLVPPFLPYVLLISNPIGKSVGFPKLGYSLL